MKEEKIIKRLKGLFRTFFEGVGDWVQPITKNPIAIGHMEITDLQFAFKENGLIELTVTLGRPGLLIGKGGRTIDALEEYLSDADNKVKILIIESTLWR